jgi:hypothetical protein
MTDPQQWLTSMTHVISAALRAITPATDRATDDGAVRDRGAVSIETVLWYAAAAVSVAVVAAIIWSQIKSTAGTGVDTPSAP